MYGNMTVGELISQLEQFDDDATVRLAIQPTYPFQHDIEQVVGVEVGGIDEDEEFVLREELKDEDTDEERRDEILQILEDASDEARTVVYIGEGGQHYDAPYLPGDASRALGWR